MRKFGVPYESSIKTTPQFFAWCEPGEVYFTDLKGGDECVYCDSEYHPETEDYKTHRLVTVLGWICPVCTTAFLDWEEFIDHEHSFP